MRHSFSNFSFSAVEIMVSFDTLTLEHKKILSTTYYTHTHIKISLVFVDQEQVAVGLVKIIPDLMQFRLL